MEKRCSRCGEVKSLDCFSIQSNGPLGRRSACIDCRRIERKAKRILNPKEYNESSRRWRDANPEKVRRIRRNHKKNVKRLYPEKVRAWKIFERAMSGGKLVKEPCLKCGSEVSEGHHPDYMKPLDVDWLCMIHHREMHRNMEANSTTSY